ncbi:uncharacterized protein H6S33_011128 [Morchella sextelata]|uniref:uncharacterized protein n=1 Tax=Morchella sextelata TaxID=1174677 RepID=UPI001D03B078|nr:uncharacterized protein H6S33_011128 [Morchella sextelata]KAH0611863.1 hypothetical protein H6S33_011128 [Morchella sextelata]
MKKHHADDSAAGEADSDAEENTSDTNQGKRKYKPHLRNRRTLCFEALFLPEVLFTHARRQWREASRLHKTLIAGHYSIHHMSDTDGKFEGAQATCIRGRTEDTSWRLRLKGRLARWKLSRIGRFWMYIHRFNYTKDWATVPMDAVRPSGKWHRFLATIWAMSPEYDHTSAESEKI